jgi:AmiR/NasT family two-component response regulator
MTLGSFAGRTALIVHRADRHRDALEAQLHRAGLSVRSLSPAARIARADTEVDVIFFDADTGHDSLFYWGRSPPPMPLVAIISSEAPGRIESALSQFACAFMMKPIDSGGAFQALIVAFHLHGEMQRLRQAVGDLSERVRARPLVVRAVLEVMEQHRIDETRALDRLRRAAMEARMTVEALAAAIAAQPTLAGRLHEERPTFATNGGASPRTSRQS